MNRIKIALCLLFLAGSLSARAQLAVDLHIKRRAFIRYEPIIATVSITNLSGREILLQDGQSQWFGFQINHGAAENMVPPRNPNYRLDPLAMKPGETMKRSVTLNSLFPLDEFGIYRIRAAIYSDSMNKFFTSRPRVIDITEGRVVWQQTVGVPDGLPNAGSTHKVSLLAFQSDKQFLYCRIEDRDAGVILCTHQLGHLVEGMQPEVQFDTQNNLYILNVAGPKLYTLTQISVNGDFLGRTNYGVAKSRPTLRRLADGTLQVVGGIREIAKATAVNALPPPKLSDRPPLPK